MATFDHIGTFDAILFDMDGTLVDSTAGVVGAWHTFKETYPDLNVEEILNTSHGVRTVDNLRIYCGITDQDELEREAQRFELEIINSASKNGKEGIVRLPGVTDIVNNVLLVEEAMNRWAICTSATNGYASNALRIAKIPVPKHFVVAEDVENGKPSPDPYLLGAKLCSVNPQRCLVVEDAPAGIASGRTAGCKTLALTTSHTREVMKRASPDFLVQNLSKVSMKLGSDGVDVRVELDKD